jgi:putative transcriptional regulator
MGEKRIRSIRQLSEETKINRLSLTKIYDGEAKGVDLATLNTLCTFFDCSVGDLLEFVKD